jgi:two-component system sensor histidine kinase KdpD
LLVDIPEELPPVELDYVQIDEVLSNLIENATKYSPEGTRIEVVVRQGEGELLVVVSNHGPEIPEAALPHLFEPFYQVDGGVRSGSGGTGLGLAVARGLVDAHGGRLWASSGPDETSFTFSLPMAEPARIVASGSEGGAD